MDTIGVSGLLANIDYHSNNIDNMLDSINTEKDRLEQQLDLLKAENEIRPSTRVAELIKKRMHEIFALEFSMREIKKAKDLF